MPHDKSGNLLMVGDWVAGRIERSPGDFWEGFGRVMELRDGPVCNITIGTINDTHPWTESDNGEAPFEVGTPYMRGTIRASTHRGTNYRVDVLMIDCSARDVQLVNTGDVTRAFVAANG